MTPPARSLVLSALAALAFAPAVVGQQQEKNPWAQKYIKSEHRIVMRDGVELFTAVYRPRDTSTTYPILMKRTPYRSAPYGEDKYPERLGPSKLFAEEGFIFVYQDVRGRYQSGGNFVHVTPHIDKKKTTEQVDESSDTFDTIEWLLENVSNHNGRVGISGISYPGFYTIAGAVDSHPALAAISPQAPVANWYFDDFIHHGAFFLAHAFRWLSSNAQDRSGLITERPSSFEYPTRDGYQLFLDVGPMKNVDPMFLKGKVEFWNKMVEHPNNDEFWQRKNLLPHLHNINCPVMLVTGWYDAEDLYGSFEVYRSVEEKNPGIVNTIVVGPWAHGGWSRPGGDHLGSAYFESNTADLYREQIELPFFKHYLKDGPDPKLPEAYVFETGSNKWRQFDDWPPAASREQSLYLTAGGGLSFDRPAGGSNFDQYLSDPARPVPYTETITPGMTREYMTDDQRFAARRPDVLVYQTDILEKDVTLTGTSLADFWISTSGTDCDLVVKLIDVFPDDTENHKYTPPLSSMGGNQMMIRSEVIRCRYRNDYAKPQAMVPDKPTRIKLRLMDVQHCFEQGHRIMIHVQSSWFPLVDRNPQKYVPNIFLADEGDFQSAIQRVYHSRRHPSALKVRVMDDK